MPECHEDLSDDIPDEYLSIDDNKISSIVHYSFVVHRPVKNMIETEIEPNIKKIKIMNIKMPIKRINSWMIWFIILIWNEIKINIEKKAFKKKTNTQTNL